MDRQKFKNEANKNIDELFDKVEKLKSKKDSLSGSAKAKYEMQIAALNQKKAELKLKYDSLKESSETNWEKAKKEFSESFNHYKTGLTELSNIFK
jgi:hypothetical protein